MSPNCTKRTKLNGLGSYLGEYVGGVHSTHIAHVALLVLLLNVDAFGFISDNSDNNKRHTPFSVFIICRIFQNKFFHWKKKKWHIRFVDKYIFLLFEFDMVGVSMKLFFFSCAAYIILHAYYLQK